MTDISAGKVKEEEHAVFTVFEVSDRLWQSMYRWGQLLVMCTGPSVQPPAYKRVASSCTYASYRVYDTERLENGMSTLIESFAWINQNDLHTQFHSNCLILMRAKNYVSALYPIHSAYSPFLQAGILVIISMDWDLLVIRLLKQHSEKRIPWHSRK